MKLDRRNFIALAGLTAVAGVSNISTLQPLIDPVDVEAMSLYGLQRPSVLFSNSRLAGATWTPRGLPVPTGPSKEVILDTYQKHGIIMASSYEDWVMAEIHAANRQEIVVQVEQDWLKGLCASARNVRFDPQSVVSPTFVGDVHNKFVDTVLMAGGEHANAAIVSPTMLTVMMSAIGHNMRRTTDQADHWPSSGTMVRGVLDEHLTIIVNSYSKDDPVLVGYLPDNFDDRKASLVQVGLSDFEFGTLPGWDDPAGWRSVSYDGEISFV